MQQEDLEKLNVAVKLNLDSVGHGTRSYSPAEFLSIQKILRQSCLSLEKQFANALLDPVDNTSIVV